MKQELFRQLVTVPGAVQQGQQMLVDEREGEVPRTALEYVDATPHRPAQMKLTWPL
jgi:hypothetical protein